MLHRVGLRSGPAPLREEELAPFTGSSRKRNSDCDGGRRRSASGPPRSDLVQYHRPEMSAITHLFAGVPVSDLDASIDWYTRFFGRPPRQPPRGRDSLGDRRERLALHRAERGEGGRGPDHPLRRWARRASPAPRRPAHRARTDRDLLERCPPRERPRSGWERDRVRRAARRRERATSIGWTRGFVIATLRCLLQTEAVRGTRLWDAGAGSGAVGTRTSRWRRPLAFA
jgi:hypothetical protein